MSQSLLPGALAGAVAGGLCFGILSLISASPAVEPGPGLAAVAPGPAAAELDVDEQLTALRAENQMLSGRLGELEARMSAGGSLAAQRQVLGDESAVLAPEEVAVLKQLAGSMPDQTGTVPAGLYGSVAQVVSDLEDQEREERDARRREAELERFDERMTEMRAELGLDDGQADAMRGHYMQRMDSREQILNEARETGDFFSIRDSMRESQDLYDAALEGVMSPAQFASYQEQFSDRGFGGGPGGGFGGGGRGGRGR